MNAISDHKFVHHKVHRQINYFRKTSIEFEIIRTWIHPHPFGTDSKERISQTSSSQCEQVIMI